MDRDGVKKLLLPPRHSASRDRKRHWVRTIRDKPPITLTRTVDSNVELRL